MNKTKLVNLATFVLALLMITTIGFAEDKAESLEKATFAVEGMTCGGCVGAVKIQLKRTAGVKDYEVSLDEAEAVVSYDPEVTDPETIAESITKSGFKATPREKG